MARPTKKSAARLRTKLRAVHKAKGKKGWPAGKPHLEITKDRLRAGALLSRLERQALGELTKKERMSGLDASIAQYLVDKIIPKAVAPQQLQVSGNITVVRRDPTHRPEGYQRKGRASV